MKINAVNNNVHSRIESQKMNFIDFTKTIFSPSKSKFLAKVDIESEVEPVYNVHSASHSPGIKSPCAE